MTTTPEKYFLKTWVVTDGGGTDVCKNDQLKIEKDGDGTLRFVFSGPDGVMGFGDGHWDQFQELEYDPSAGALTCRFPKTTARSGSARSRLGCERTAAARGPVAVEIVKFSNAGIRCRVTLEIESPRESWQNPQEDPGGWVAEEEGGSA